MRTNLGHGFFAGVNRITKQQVCYWLHTNQDITWNAFVWYIADYCDIDDFGIDWVAVKIFTEKQRQFFYEKVCEYEELICASNYEVALDNDLWETHKRGAERNRAILLCLIQSKDAD